MLLVDATTLNGRYTLGRLIGKGGMGAVYEADDVALQRRVAVKVLSPELARGRSALGRFEREARAASAIRTEHIVRVLDADVDRATGSPFLVMELLRGEDLAHLLDRLGPLPPRLALRIVAQACVGLERAHEAGVVHRDIKPANLFLARREGGGGLVVKLLDFGVAKIRPAHDPRRDTTGLTWSGHVLGTPRYMSPQARGIKDIDHRTDLWSLGVVLYRALAGRTPTEDVKSVGELITALVADLPRRSRTSRRGSRPRSPRSSTARSSTSRPTGIRAPPRCATPSCRCSVRTLSRWTRACSPPWRRPSASRSPRGSSRG
ncbi:hypothetical protein BE20_22515 [Sorangium cellulosum]|nr:hypothetical protein BE20_22515 [Sorangium cellulosum]